MALIGEDNIRRSYECTELINEVIYEIGILGDHKVASLFQKISGSKFYYGFLELDDIKNVNESFEITNMSQLLEYLIAQNQI